MLQRYELGALLLQGLQDAGSGLSGLAAKVTQGAAIVSTAVLHLLVVVFGAVYLAANPRIYRQGLLKLFPQAARARVAGATNASADALRLPGRICLAKSRPSIEPRSAAAQVCFGGWVTGGVCPGAGGFFTAGSPPASGR